MADILAVIPARGGSRGIPMKNLQLLAGKPLLAYAIEAARQSALVTRVAVSTDCSEIAAVSAEYGAEVVMRPAAISGDTASSEAAISHVLAHFGQQEGYVPELVAFMQCTVPFTRGAQLDAAITKLRDGGLDCCFSAVPFDKFLWGRGEGGGAVGINHDSASQRQRRQDVPEQALETGAFYIMRTQAYLRNSTRPNRFCGKTDYLLLDGVLPLDIDTPCDLELARLWISRSG